MLPERQAALEGGKSFPTRAETALISPHYFGEIFIAQAQAVL